MGSQVQTIVAAAIHKCPENLLVWQKIQVKQIKGYTFCINMSFTAKFLEKTRVRNLSESSEGGDTRGDAQAAGTGYDVMVNSLISRFRLMVNRCASQKRQLMRMASFHITPLTLGLFHQGGMIWTKVSTWFP